MAPIKPSGRSDVLSMKDAEGSISCVFCFFGRTLVLAKGWWWIDQVAGDSDKNDHGISGIEKVSVNLLAGSCAPGDDKDHGLQVFLYSMIPGLRT